MQLRISNALFPAIWLFLFLMEMGTLLLPAGNDRHFFYVASLLIDVASFPLFYRLYNRQTLRSQMDMAVPTRLDRKIVILNVLMILMTVFVAVTTSEHDLQHAMYIQVVLLASTIVFLVLRGRPRSH